MDMEKITSSWLEKKFPELDGFGDIAPPVQFFAKIRIKDPKKTETIRRSVEKIIREGLKREALLVEYARPYIKSFEDSPKKIFSRKSTETTSYLYIPLFIYKMNMEEKNMGINYNNNTVFEEILEIAEAFKSGKSRFNYGPRTSTAGKKLATFDKSRTAAGKTPIFKKQEDGNKKETMKEGIILSFSEEAIRALRESDEQQKRMLQLIRTGIVPRSDVSKMIIALNNAKDDKALTKQQKDMLIDLLSKLSDFVTGDNAVFAKAKMAAVGMRD